MRAPFLLVWATASLLDVTAHAQQDAAEHTEAGADDADVNLALWAAQGLAGSEAELEAWNLLQARRWIGAREAADAALEADPDSYIAHLVLGQVQHYAEASFPRALYHLDRARVSFEARHGSPPGPEAPWRWHANILRELGSVYGALERHEERLHYIAVFNELYEPDMIAERAWPLMKLGRYEEARLAAELAMNIPDRPMQRSIALNSMCAIEFEAGNDGASYDACRAAVEEVTGMGGRASAVDLTNLAEASRSLFHLDEAERIELEAARADVSWYGNPWMELASLYTREARFAEAISALKEIPAYRTKRPPHVRDADRNEVRRVLSAFLVVVGRVDAAMGITEQALRRPDRRGHNSRDPAQDRVVVALLDRRARLLAAELELERAAAQPLWKRPWHWVRAGVLWSGARRSAALVERLLDDDRRLIGSFRIGTAAAAVMPPWLAGELVGLLGPGVVQEALDRARARDSRPRAVAYYDAFAAEAAWHAGRPEVTAKLGGQALSGLGAGEVLLRARVHALVGQARLELGQPGAAAAAQDAAFQADPGVFRRLGLELPVRVRTEGAVAPELADHLLDSPRFREDDAGLELHVQASAASARVCLVGPAGQLGCGEASAKANEDAEAFARRASDAVHAELFAPRVNLSQTDINSLDGHNLVGKDALEDLLQE